MANSPAAVKANLHGGAVHRQEAPLMLHLKGFFQAPSILGSSRVRGKGLEPGGRAALLRDFGHPPG